jgi:hydrogenase maturation protein HypF
MALEQLALRGRADAAAYSLGLVESGGLPAIDSAPLWPALFEDLRGGRPPADIARAFHYALADALLTLTEKLAAQHRTQLVALSGGVLQNRLLLERLHTGLRERDLTPLLHRSVPANDGGISLGQACIAACILQSPDSNM